MTDSKRRSARVLRERKRSKYYDPGSEDDFVDGDSSEGEEDYQPEQTEQVVAGPPQTQRSRKKRKLDRRRKPETRAKEKRMQKFRSKVERGIGQPKKKRGVNWIPLTPSKAKDVASRGFTGPSDGVIPDWTRLPPEIWRDVFVFASQPIHEQTTVAINNVTWLMRTARSCRAFAIPALEAYYESPAILPTTPPHYLLELLRKPQEAAYMNYKTRVKSLEIDVRRLALGSKGSHPFRLEQLVEELPRLQHLEIVQAKQIPPFRSMRKQPWRYDSPIFRSLQTPGARLKTWRWSRDLMPAELAPPYTWMIAIHNTPPFQVLQRLVLCDFAYHEDLSTDPSADTVERPAKPGLALAISALPALKDLTFISCDAVAEDFLEHISTHLERLELSNCLEVTSGMIYSYLALGGSQLRELVLNHNAALNLSFSEHLKAMCPRLEVLKMDFTYYSERVTYNDSVALYDYVLTSYQVPTWPSSLRQLELVHMQKWEAEAAQNLFRSLVDSAKDLPNLRYLALQAHINIPWRDRAGFRDQWIERLRRVYLRKQEDPNPHLGSLKQFRLWKQTQQSELGTGPSNAAAADSDYEPIRRRMSHVRVTPRKTPIDAELYPDTTSPNPQGRPRRSVRVAESQTQNLSQSTSTAAEDSSSSGSEAEDDWRKEPEPFIQGLCEVVDIRIDNQRPRENQYTEANFLDSEPSGDEDWNEDAAMEMEGSEDERYAW